MKLNYNCLREMLLAMERLCDFKDGAPYTVIDFKLMISELNKYDKDDIWYVAEKAVDAGLIKAKVLPHNGKVVDILFWDVTFKGHEFLQKIKSETVWKTSLKIAEKIGSKAISVIENIAAQVISHQIDKLISFPSTNPDEN